MNEQKKRKIKRDGSYGLSWGRTYFNTRGEDYLGTYLYHFTFICWTWTWHRVEDYDGVFSWEGDQP